MKNAKQYNIICFSFMPWSSMWKRNQSMMAEMAKLDFVNSVIFVNPDTSLWHIFNRKRTNGNGNITNTLFPQKIGSNLWLYTPVYTLPFKYHFKPLVKLESKVHVRKLRRLNNEKPYILFMNCPNILYQYPLDELLKNSAFNIFDFSDDFVELVPNKKGKNKYLANINKYAQAADTVLTVNAHIKAKYAHLNKNIHIIKNATNYQNFDRNNYGIIPFLENLNNNQMPIIGYTGMSNISRIDLDILKYLLQNKPKWQYVFIGIKSQELMEIFSHYKNFFNLPNVPYELLPDHINYFDVAIVPFRINAHTKGNNLLKLHDYLAMGKPIVTTKIGGAEDFKDVVRIAHTPEAFLKEIEKALIDTSQNLIQRRKKIAFENSWPNRIKEVEELIKRHLDIPIIRPSLSALK